MWNTVDLDKTNVRSKAYSRFLQGFPMYLIITGKNFTYEAKTESRWRDMLLVCNVLESSGPIDTQGLLYMTNKDVEKKGGRKRNSADGSAAEQQGGKRARTAEGLDSSGSSNDVSMKDVMDHMESGMDGGVLRGGIMKDDANAMCRNKVLMFFFLHWCMCVCVCVCV
jgi:hypothetical protein